MPDQLTATDRAAAPATAAAPAAVLGLGPMGAALARALLAAGVQTTVWNRTLERADPLRTEGATVADDVRAAVTAADLVVVCLRDHTVVRAAFADVGAADLTGRTVVNLTSATPAEARGTAEWFAARGAGYLSGAIMVPTPLIGRPEALILYSGDPQTFHRNAERLRPFAGTVDHVGADHGAASLHDVAMLEVYFAAMTAFVHAAAMVTAQGVTARAFLPYAEQIVSWLPETLAGLAAEVDSGGYPGTEDRVEMELAALEHMVATSTELGLDAGLPRVMRDLAARTVSAGYGENSYTSVVEAIRRPA